MARRASFLNYCQNISDGKFQVFKRQDNAQVVGADYGLFCLEHDDTVSTVRVRLYSDNGKGTLLSESALIAVSTLPATVTDDGGNPVTFSIFLDGVY